MVDYLQFEDSTACEKAIEKIKSLNQLILDDDIAELRRYIDERMFILFERYNMYGR
jgi:hypothetical protein